MDSNVKLLLTDANFRQHDIFNDKVTRSKIYRHLVDINDTISEDDIRNVKVAIPELGNMHYIDENNLPKHHRTVTPWDLYDAEA